MKIMKIKYDYSKLRGLIIEKFKSLDNFADVLPMGRTTLNNKLQSYNYFTQIEIETICEILQIAKEDRNAIFFTRE
jgi:hypothetical protein